MDVIYEQHNHRWKSARDGKSYYCAYAYLDGMQCEDILKHHYMVNTQGSRSYIRDDDLIRKTLLGKEVKNDDSTTV